MQLVAVYKTHRTLPRPSTYSLPLVPVPRWKNGVEYVCWSIDWKQLVKGGRGPTILASQTMAKQTHAYTTFVLLYLASRKICEHVQAGSYVSGYERLNFSLFIKRLLFHVFTAVRDREFSCDVQRDGKVCVRGVTSTGGKIVQKYSRVYEMKFQQQSPPGPFTLFFNLPGPVDPRLFSPHFRSDGIFEAVVAKY
ncbi:hypothetical protein SASPL_131499 [Salvia splendens]|uniref:SHSP domain-containing protein n=1 Tax=Salvia splendens TaxID=180675 RepID=A0A8X8X7J9_SALSN|nr:hypothetical protein SASPL_131499 [Salvia splendens]